MIEFLIVTVRPDGQKVVTESEGDRYKTTVYDTKDVWSSFHYADSASHAARWHQYEVERED